MVFSNEMGFYCEFGFLTMTCFVVSLQPESSIAAADVRSGSVGTVLVTATGCYCTLINIYKRKR
jgi:hypothetical protein